MGALRPLQKANFTDVLDYGIYLFKKHFKSLFIINLIFNIPVMLVLTVFNPIFTEQYWNLLNPTDLEVTGPEEIISSLFTMYAMLFGLLGLQGLYAVTLKNVMEGSIVKIIYADTVLNQKRTVKQVIKECFNQFGTLFLGRLLYILIQSAVFIILYIVLIIVMFAVTFGIAGIVITSFANTGITIVLSVLAALILIGIVFFISLTVAFYYGRYWMFLPAVCIEQKKAGSGIGRCNSLTKGNFFLIGLTMVFGYLFTGLFPLMVNLIFNAVSLYSGNFDVELFRIGTAVTQILSEILRPLITCIMTALYITLRVKREGLDLEMTLWDIKREEAYRKKTWMAEAPDVN